MAIQKFFWRRRYLRAIPSLVVLTTAMAWGVSLDAEIMGSTQKNVSVLQSSASDQHTKTIS